MIRVLVYAKLVTALCWAFKHKFEMRKKINCSCDKKNPPTRALSSLRQKRLQFTSLPFWFIHGRRARVPLQAEVPLQQRRAGPRGREPRGDVREGPARHRQGGAGEAREGQGQGGVQQGRPPSGGLRRACLWWGGPEGDCSSQGCQVWPFRRQKTNLAFS